MWVAALTQESAGSKTVGMAQQDLDRLTYDAYVDHGCNATRTAYQLGVSRQTVKDRVGRHVKRLQQLAHSQGLKLSELDT